MTRDEMEKAYRDRTWLMYEPTWGDILETDSLVQITRLHEHRCDIYPRGHARCVLPRALRIATAKDLLDLGND